MNEPKRPTRWRVSIDPFSTNPNLSIYEIKEVDELLDAKDARIVELETALTRAINDVELAESMKPAWGMVALNLKGVAPALRRALKGSK